VYVNGAGYTAAAKFGLNPYPGAGAVNGKFKQPDVGPEQDIYIFILYSFLVIFFWKNDTFFRHSILPFQI